MQLQGLIKTFMIFFISLEDHLKEEKKKIYKT